MQRVVTVLLLAAVAGGALIAGCDIPTAAPILELRWALTAAETTLGVEDLLREGRISLAVDDTAAARGSRRLLPASAANESPPGSCEPASSAGEVVSGEGSITVSAEPICVAWTLAELCPTGHGLSMSVRPTWGVTASGVNGLWEHDTLDLLAGSDAAGGRVEAEIGYGLPAFGTAGVLTPYAGAALTGAGAHSLSLGGRLELGPAFDLTLEAERRESADAEPVHDVTLEGTFRW